MPSKSRKKIKGQARKAKAKEAAATTSVVRSELSTRTVQIPNQNNSICDHGAVATPPVGMKYITSFFQSYKLSMDSNKISLSSVKLAMDNAYNKCPEAVNNIYYRDILKKNFISNGASSLLGRQSGTHALHISYGYAVAFMLIDSYDPSSNSVGIYAHDANNYLRNVDIMNGCQRSLVKYFMKQIPCNCLNDLYAKVKSKMPKMGKCPNCKQRKERSELFICTGCERVQYCSNVCQKAHIPEHKDMCKGWQKYFVSG